MNKVTSAILAVPLVLILVGGNANAAPISVLWLSGDTSYNNAVGELGAGSSRDAVTYDPGGNGSNSWSIDFWSSGTPTFSNYDAFVVGSICKPDCGSDSDGGGGFFGNGVQPDLVLSNKSELSAARGDRVFVSGQDADWHFWKDGSSTDREDARAFLINAVNWAATGEGLGIVALADGYAPTNSTTGWIDDPNSFLKSEIGASRTFLDSENVIIPAASASFPINEGLTTSKLSDWGVSSHTAFEKSSLLADTWASINDEGFDGSSRSVTIVTASEASGDTTPVTVPLPSTLALLGFGLLGLFAARRRV